MAAGATLSMMVGSITLSGVTFYHPYLFAVLGAEGATPAQILLYITVLMLAIVASMMFIGGPLLPRVGARTLMIVGAVIVAGALALFSVANSLTMLYVSAAVMGLGYGASFQLVPMVWVNNWFATRKGLVVGIVTGGTGIGGVLWSIIVPALGGTPGPTNYGYRAAYLVMAAIVLAVTLVAVFVLATPEKPAQAGMLPLGAAPRMGSDASPGDDARPVVGLTFAQALRSPWLWLIFACTVLLGIVHGAAQIMAPYLTMRATAEPPVGLGQPLAYYSLLMSVWTIGLIFVKPALGILNDKIGVIGAMAIALALQAVFFLFMPHFASFGTVVPIVMMLLMSSGMATGTVEPPLLTSQAMGLREFGKIWSVTGSAYTLGVAFGAPIWGTFYEPATKSYTTGFLLAPIALAIVLVGAIIGTRAGRRQCLAQHAKELATWEAASPV